jgi:muconate cycloisomerase
MRISELSAYHVRIPLRRKIRHASHTRTDTDTLIVRCKLSDGTEGWGEGLPRQYVTGETIDAVFELLRATDWSTQLGGPLGNLLDAVALCDRVRFVGVPPQARDCSAIRSNALELSILDAVSRSLGVPLSSLTGSLPEAAAVRQNVDQVRYSATITSMGPSRRFSGVNLSVLRVPPAQGEGGCRGSERRRRGAPHSACGGTEI